MFIDLLLNFLCRIGTASSSSISSSTEMCSSSHWRQIPSLMLPEDDKKQRPHRTQFSCCSSSWVFMCALKLQAKAKRLLHSSQACGLSPDLGEEKEKKREIIKLFCSLARIQWPDLCAFSLAIHAYGNEKEFKVSFGAYNLTREGSETKLKFILFPIELFYANWISFLKKLKLCDSRYCLIKLYRWPFVSHSLFTSRLSLLFLLNYFIGVLNFWSLIDFDCFSFFSFALFCHRRRFFCSSFIGHSNVWMMEVILLCHILTLMRKIKIMQRKKYSKSS